MGGGKNPLIFTSLFQKSFWDVNAKIRSRIIIAWTLWANKVDFKDFK